MRKKKEWKDLNNPSSILSVATRKNTTRIITMAISAYLSTIGSVASLRLISFLGKKGCYLVPEISLDDDFSVLDAAADSAFGLQALAQGGKVVVAANETFDQGNLLSGTAAAVYADNQTCSSDSVESYLKSGLVEKTTPSLFFQSFLAIT